MGTLTSFDPAKAGFRVAGPIRRKPRTPSTKAAPKPQYADAVWYSFQQGTPLEAKVRTGAVEDTVRRLKRAARYLERTHKVEVRVQISVEPVTEQAKDAEGNLLFEGGEPVMVPVKPARSLVKFLGHEPYMLGRRISQARAQELAGSGVVVAEQEVTVNSTDLLGRPNDVTVTDRPKHRRTVAGTRAQHAKSALQHALVWPVITAGESLIPVVRDSSFFLVRSCCEVVMEPIDSPYLCELYHGRFSTRDGRLGAWSITGSTSR